MERWQEWLIGGILCLIIGIVFTVMNGRISAGSVASFGLFLYGVYRAIRKK